MKNNNLCECAACKAGREMYERILDSYFREHEVEYSNKTFKRVKKNEKSV